MKLKLKSSVCKQWYLNKCTIYNYRRDSCTDKKFAPHIVTPKVFWGHASTIQRQDSSCKNTNKPLRSDLTFERSTINVFLWLFEPSLRSSVSPVRIHPPSTVDLKQMCISFSRQTITLTPWSLIPVSGAIWYFDVGRNHKVSWPLICCGLSV